MASCWSSDKGKTLLYHEPLRPCLIWPLSSPALCHPTRPLAFCGPGHWQLYLSSPCFLVPQGLCTCSLYLKCSCSLFTYTSPLILQNRFWPGLLPQGKPQIRSKTPVISSPNTKQVSLSPSGPTSWVCNSCSYRALCLAEPDSWFDALLSPSRNS